MSDHEIIEALMHAENIAALPTGNEASEEVCSRAWAIIYLLQRARNPGFRPENYDEVLVEARCYNGLRDDGAPEHREGVH
jgi:hypothetical protein